MEENWWGNRSRIVNHAGSASGARRNGHHRQRDATIVNQLRVTGSAHCGRVINQMRTTAAYCRPLAGVPARGTENEGKGYGDPREERRGEALLLSVSTKPGIAAASRDCEKLNCTRVI